MADEAVSGGGGSGDPGYLAIYDYQALRAAVMADSPDGVNRLVLLWRRLSEVVENLATDLARTVEATRTVYTTPQSAPAFFDSLIRLQGWLHDVAVDLHDNALTMDQADLALRAAQREMADLHGDGTTALVDLRTGKDVRAEEAGRIAYQLNDAYGAAVEQLALPDADPDRDWSSPDDPGAGQSLGAPAVAYVPAPSPSGRLGAPAPRQRGAGGPVGGGPGSRNLPTPGTSSPAGRGATPAGNRGVIGGVGNPADRRTVAPAARGGVLGGSRIPTLRGGLLGSTAASGSGPAATPPGGPGPGGPVRPGAAPPGSGPDGGPGRQVPPGGMPGQGGGPRDDRRGRRLSWYEKIEDEFVEQRYANPPGGTIGGDRTPPRTVDPGPSVIGNQKQPPAADSTPITWQVTDRAAAQQNTSGNGSDTPSQDGATFQIRRRSSGA